MSSKQFSLEIDQLWKKKKNVLLYHFAYEGWNQTERNLNSTACENDIHPPLLSSLIWE